jgi:pyruvate dehydrogenase E2 component (dihydrolipoyllysine-residue acetyltransferase)
MPKLSDSMEQATILSWLKQPGDEFTRGDPLVEIETDKATILYEAETDGVLAEIVVPAGETARLGEPIAILAGGSHNAAQVAARSASAPSMASAPPAVPPPSAGGAPGRVSATPVARRRAAELGVSLLDLKGTGEGDRITRADVERAAGEPSAEQTPASRGFDRGAVETPSLTSTQRTIAKRMEASTTVPVFTVSVEIDMTTIVALRTGADSAISTVPSVNDFVIRAAALTLRAFPIFNSAWAEGTIETYSRVNIGIAVALENALLVPTLFDADQKSLTQIATESRRLVEATKTRQLGPDELTHGTFTVTNLGMFGVHSFTAIVNTPQAAILAVGGIARRPAETDGLIELRHTMNATLSADHRVVYGADGAAFLAHLKSLLEHPLALTT